MDKIQGIINASTHSIIVLDGDGIITNINHLARDHFGLIKRSQYSHEAGQINQGDFVILGDTSIGEDDGNLRPQDLERIGIFDHKIHPGDKILAAGEYGSKGKNAVYKHVRAHDTQNLGIETKWNSIPISAHIRNGEITVTVGEMQYSIEYFMSICQVVVLDCETHKTKFWQEKGYSAKKEGVGNLLRGGRFMEKTAEMTIDVVGFPYSNFFEGKDFEESLRRVREGGTDRIIDQIMDINGYALVVSILPVDRQDRSQGTIVRFRKIEDMKATIAERNEAIAQAETTYRKASSLPKENEFYGLFGNSKAMSEAKRFAYKLSQLNCNILITGESGTGKSYMARAIVREQRRKGNFVSVDCSTIAPTLFESEMFGYVGGAFTGANAKGKKGFFEEADGGTIFLDEIGEVPLGIQAKLLNVIQEKTICRVGSTKQIPVDVRIIAATNRDLKKEVEQGRFRADLYYRLSAFSLELPPLRKSGEDIYFLINHLMEQIRGKYGMEEKYLSGETFNKLIGYHWPGNIRELENVLERAVALSESEIIYPEHIDLPAEEQRITLKEQLKAEEKRIILQTLIQCNGNRKKAMEQLGVSKAVFYKKLKEYGIGTV